MTTTLVSTQTPILCPQCGHQVAIRENLSQNNRALMIRCANCKLGLIVDTTEEAS